MSNLSYEDAMAELEAIIQKIEKNQVPLAEGVAIRERALALLAYTDQLLQQAEAPATAADRVSP